MSVLFLSIATSGLPGATKQVWCPRMSAALCDESGVVLDNFSVNIRSDGRHVESAASKIHGITTAQASRTGIDEAFALTSICGLRASGRRTADRPGLISCARVLVAWDADFVSRIITDLFAKHGEPSQAWRRPGLQIISLQMVCRAFCKIACPDGDDSGAYKMPTRDEAAAELLDAPPRTLPRTTDSNLDLERALYTVLKERKVFEMEAVA